MRARFSTVPLVVLLATLAFGQDSARDLAWRKLKACLKNPSVENQACQGDPVGDLYLVYKGGDESVVPLLLAAYPVQTSGAKVDLPAMYADILVRSPQVFLDVLASSSAEEKASVMDALAVRSDDRSELERRRAVLLGVPKDSTRYSIAMECLRRLETRNAYLLKHYFPPGVFGQSRADRFLVIWYSQNFFALGEEPLWNQPSADSVIYRFTWLRTFDNPVALTFTVFPDGGTTLRLSVANGAGGYYPGKLILDEEHLLTHDDAEVFLGLIEHRAAFWDMPTDPPSSDTVGTDGAQWIMEGMKDGKYHIVDRWSPDRGPYRDAAMFLIRKSGYKVTKDEIY